MGDFSTKMLDYVVNSLPSLFKKKEKTTKNVKKITEYLCEDADNFNISLDIQNNSGISVDLYGALVGIKREGRNDENYKMAIKFDLALRTPTITEDDVRNKIKMVLDIEKLLIYPKKNNIIVIYAKFKNIHLNINTLKKILPAGMNFVFKFLTEEYLIIDAKTGERTYGQPITTENDFILTDENGTAICADFFETKEVF